MTFNEYQQFAVRFSLSPKPVIVADQDLEVVYINPAAVDAIVFSPKSNFIRKLLTNERKSLIDACREDGKPVEFSAEIGRGYTKTYKVLVHKELEPYISFQFTPVVLPEELQQNHLKKQLMSGYEYMIGTTLHDLLAGTEVLSASEQSEVSRRSKLMHKQVLKTIRVARQMQYVFGEPKGIIADFPHMMDLITQDCAKYVKENFDRNLILSIPQDTEPVKCDPVMVRNIILNLVSNAIRYSEGDIRLSCSPIKEEMLIMVTDSGPGFDPSEIDFGKADASKGVSVGAGLGLASVRELVRLQQGSFILQSDAEHGTTASFTLPLAETTFSMHESLSTILDEDISSCELEFADIE